MKNTIDFNSWLLPPGYHGREPISPEEFEGYEYYRTPNHKPLRLVMTKTARKRRSYGDYLVPVLGGLERRVSLLSDWDSYLADEISEAEYYALCAEYLASYERMARVTAAQLNEKGSRQNNEDAIYPVYGGEVHPYQRLFLVCDGVGGQEKGEVASGLLTKHFSWYLKVPGNPESLEAALRHAEAEMQETLQAKPETKGMATTLTAVYFDKAHRTAEIAWVGDSRVYHIRNGEILYKTKDHSEVQSLIDMGEISEEEARTHPKRNVITRAINGSTPARLDRHKITNIALGDYFLLCTDGLLETLKEKDFPSIFKHEEGPIAIRKALLQKAEGQTKDNFSMYLLQVNQMADEEVHGKFSKTLNQAQLKIGHYMNRVFGKKKG